MGKLKLFFACLLMTVLSIGQVWAEDVADKLTASDFTATSTTYKDFSNVSKTSDAVYAGNSAKDASGNIQLRSKNNAGVVSTTSGGTVKSVKVTVASGTNTIDVYGSNTAYTGPSDLYGSSQGTKVGSLSATGTVTFTDDYAYVGIRSNNGALYLSEIEITWTTGGSSDPTLSLAPPSLNLEAEGNSTQEITLSTTNFAGAVNDVTCAFFSTATCDPGDAISQPAWITNLTDNNTNLVSFDVEDNDGAARSVWMKVTASDGTGSASAILAISQKALVVDYATLPFAFDGGKADIETTNGMTQGSLDNSDYSASPKLKFKNQGSWVIIKINADPGTLTYDIKGNSVSGTYAFDVEQSADGETYSNVTTHTSLSGSKESKEFTLNQTTRFVRFIYTTKASGNVGLGNIAISEYVAPSTVATPTITGAEKFITSTTVSISCTTTGAEIYYTLDGSDPQISGSKQLYSDPFSVTAAGSVNARAKLGDDWSGMTTKTFVKVDPIDVHAAIEAIPNDKDKMDDQYVRGIVCTAAPSLLSGGKLTYWISADGSETNRLQIFKGKNLNNTEFAAATDLALGDRVVVFGQLYNYNGTPEMNDGNYLVERVAALVAAPVFTPDGGGFMGETDVTITCATAGSVIYYTTDGETPSKLSTPYTAAIHLDATTTIKAIAYVNDDPSIVITKTFTLSAPMTVAEALTALDSEDPINNVAVAGIISTAPTNNPNSGRLTYYISDDGSTTSQLEVFNGYGLNGASFSDKTDLQIGDEVTVFGNLKIFSGSSGDVKEFDAGNRLLAFNRPEVPVTAVEMAEVTAEIEVGSTVTLHAHVMPENATDQSLTWTIESGSDKASVDENGVVTGVAEGTAVIRAASPDYPYYAECTVTVTAADPTKHVVTFDATVDKGESPLSKSNITFTCSNGILNNGTEYRLYKNSTNTFECSAGYITKIEFTGVSGNPVSGFEDPAVGTLVIDGNDGVWTGNAESISFIASGAQVRATQINVTYKEDNREEAGIAFTPENVSITEGEPWSEPVFTNPHDLDVTFSSNNESVAKVSDAGAVSLQDGTGTAVITATFDGNDTYKPATVTYTITVNAPLSPWATTWTSNLDDITGSKVKFYGEETEYAALKAGTGSVAGTATLNIPAQATELHLHAYGWNSEDVTLSITAPDGVTVTPASITLNRNSGFAGNSPFTLAEGSTPQTDAYYALSLSGNTDAIELTISATEGKRFLLFGVNQVGGVLPELQSIAISGDLTNKSYEAGQAIDMTGLTVEATYTLAGVPQTPVDITDDPNLEWSYAPLVKDQTSVEITASFEGKNAQKTIDGLTVTEATPAITASPSFANFNNVSKDALVAAKTINVTLTNVATATVALSGTGADAFLIDKNSLDASGTISITPVTTTIGNYSAKITISDDAGVATAATVTIMMNVMPVDEGDALLSGVWTLVTDASQLVDGSKVIIAQYVNADGVIRTMSTQNNNNRASVESTVAGTALTPAEGTRVMTLEALAGGKYAFRTNINTYLYAASSSSNYLKEELELNDNGRWTISIEDGNKAVITATGTNSHRIMRYNEGSELFSCYESGQKDVQLFIRTVDYSRTDMFSPGVIGTVCVDHNVPFAGIEGATFYELAGLVSTGFIAFDEIIAGELEAGVPYLFEAKANELKLYYGTTTVPSPVNPGNGMYGTFDPIDVTENLDDVYYFAQHNFWSCSGMSSLHMPANRAYVRMSEVPSAAPNPNPGRRRVVMGVNGTNTTTGCENIESGNAPRKQLIDGAIYIIRGEKVYDTTGRLVK